MLYLFDMDGTLVSSYMDRADRDFHAWKLLPGRRETIAALVAEGHQIGIVSNQAGVAYGFVDYDDVRKKFQAVAAQLGYGSVALYYDMGRGSHWSTGNEDPITPRTLPAYICCDRDGPRRKPGPLMIEQAHQEALIDYYNVETEEFEDVPIVFIGDRPEDEGAARAAGVPFQWAEEFFRGR